MKVLHVLHELKFSGAEIMYIAAADLFRRNGAELYVLATGNNIGENASSFQKAGYKVLHRPFPASRLSRWKYCSSMIQYLKDEKIDVVHIHRSAVRWTMAYCAWRAGIRSVYTTHATFYCKWFMRPWHVWLRWSSAHIFHTKFTSISDSAHDHELAYFLTPTTKIYNWYCEDRFFPAKDAGEKQRIRKELNIPADAPVIISVGGCRHLKRHDDIIRAMTDIVRLLPDAVYLHLGVGETLDEEKQLVDELGLNASVRFCGNQTDVRKYLIASDVYVMTSTSEGLPLTTIEAMGCRIPAVLYNVPGLRDFNKQLETAVIIPETPEALRDAVVSLYRDKERQSRLVENGYNYVTRTFTMAHNAQLIYGLYK